YTFLGNAYRRKKAYADALLAFDRALALAPHFSWPHRARGACLCELGQYDRALADHRKAIELDPAACSALADLAQPLMDMGQPAEAIPLLQQAVKLAPDHPKPYVGLGNAFFHAGQLARAEEVLRKAIKLELRRAEDPATFPGSPEQSWFILGAVL